MAKRVNESACWYYFEKPVSGKSECKFCEKKLACVGGSTSELMAHVQTVHAEMLKSASSPVQPKLTTFGVGSPTSPFKLQTGENHAADCRHACGQHATHVIGRI